MSAWTHVCGVIEVDTYANSTREAMYLAKAIVGILPRITGSEGDVEFHFNRKYDFSMHSTHDEYGRRSNLYNDSRYKMFATQTKVVLTLCEDLRDRRFAQTLRETTRMLARLASRIYVARCLVAVSGQGRSFVFHDSVWILEMCPEKHPRDFARDMEAQCQLQK